MKKVNLIFSPRIRAGLLYCAKFAPLELVEILGSKGYGWVGNYLLVQLRVDWGFRNQKTIVGYALKSLQ
jgi:hypothetical protein